jgi:hypothetical protein
VVCSIPDTLNWPAFLPPFAQSLFIKPKCRVNAGNHLIPHRHTMMMMNHRSWTMTHWYKHNMTHHYNRMTPYHPTTHKRDSTLRRN